MSAADGSTLGSGNNSGFFGSVGDSRCGAADVDDGDVAAGGGCGKRLSGESLEPVGDRGRLVDVSEFWFALTSLGAGAPTTEGCALFWELPDSKFNTPLEKLGV